MVADAGVKGRFDVKARMAQVLGKPARVEPLYREHLSDHQMEMIGRLRGSVKSRSYDHVPEFFLVAIKHPALFRHQIEAGTLFFTGTLDPRDRELAVLRIAWLCGAPYEWGEHVDIARLCGVTADEIERVTEGSAASGWGEHDAAILRGVEELLDDKMVSDGTWDTLARSWSEQQLMEFPMLVGAYVSTAFQQNTLRLRLGPDNPGLTHR
jgi:4-carboxymuconolactone decarboxylase